jgi:hypothetical protein
MKKIRWLAVFTVICLCAKPLSAQKLKPDTTTYANLGGDLSLGVRNTISFFNDGMPQSVGTGIGGHFRIQFVNRVNTEWFADVFLSNIQGKAHRADYHIGWSVMYYLLNPKGFTRKFTPYIVAGHCFDETVIKINGEGGSKGSRFSSELQGGLGCQYNVTPQFNLSLTAQYGSHLGRELDLVTHEDGSMTIEKQHNAGWEGHLMISISANYKLFKLWKPRK